MPSSGGSHRAINGALLARQDDAWCFRHSTCSGHPLLARKCRCIYYWFGEVAIHINNYTCTIQYTGCTCISWRTYVLVTWHICRACPRRSQRTAAVAMRIHKVITRRKIVRFIWSRMVTYMRILHDPCPPTTGDAPATMFTLWWLWKLCAHARLLDGPWSHCGSDGTTQVWSRKV
jgi:hypothetical protein